MKRIENLITLDRNEVAALVKEYVERQENVKVERVMVEYEFVDYESYEFDGMSCEIRSDK